MMHATNGHCFAWQSRGRGELIVQCKVRRVNRLCASVRSAVCSCFQPLALSVAAVIHVIEKSVGGEVGWKGRKRGRK